MPIKVHRNKSRKRCRSLSTLSLQNILSYDMHISTTTNLYISKSCYHHICNSLFTDRLVQILDFGEVSPDRQVLSRVTRKVLSNSKHTLLCLYGHNILARINLIPLKTLRRLAQWLEAQILQGTAHFLYAKG